MNNINTNNTNTNTNNSNTNTNNTKKNNFKGIFGVETVKINKIVYRYLFI